MQDLGALPDADQLPPAGEVPATEPIPDLQPADPAIGALPDTVAPLDPAADDLAIPDLAATRSAGRRLCAAGGAG